jgi:mono/diheme cytochrome c family protein
LESLTNCPFAVETAVRWFVLIQSRSLFGVSGFRADGSARHINLLEGKAIMKITKLVILIVMIAVALFLVLPNLSWAADDGATIYKTKCAACHGADLTGKPAAKIPSLVSETSKKASDAELTDMIANGGKDKKAMHAFSNKGLTADQIKMVIAYVREAQKK